MSKSHWLRDWDLFSNPIDQKASIKDCFVPFVISPLFFFCLLSFLLSLRARSGKSDGGVGANGERSIDKRCNASHTSCCYYHPSALTQPASTARITYFFPPSQLFVSHFLTVTPVRQNQIISHRKQSFPRELSRAVSPIKRVP